MIKPINSPRTPVAASRLALEPAAPGDQRYCEELARRNMAAYRQARGIDWDPQRFAHSWAQFENYLILLDAQPVGALRLLQIGSTLEVRDLQMQPEQQRCGIGSWALQQVKRLGLQRNCTQLRLRVYAENPAKALYQRLGFEVKMQQDGTLHLCLELIAPPSDR